jgi:hypothetical protein
MKESGKRKMALARKPAIVVAIGTKPESDPKPEMEPKGLTCPECGAMLQDTPENQKYVASKAEKPDVDDSEDDE